MRSLCAPSPDGKHSEATARKRFCGSTPARASPGLLGCREQRRQRGAEVLLEVRRERVEGSVAGVERRGEPALGRDEPRVAVQPLRERLAGRVGARESRCRSGAGVDLAAEHGRDEVRALREVAVDRPDADAGLRRDLAHGRVDARGGEDLLGCLKQRVDVAPGVRADAALRRLGVVLGSTHGALRLDGKGFTAGFVHISGTGLRLWRSLDAERRSGYALRVGRVPRARLVAAHHTSTQPEETDERDFPSP